MGLKAELSPTEPKIREGLCGFTCQKTAERINTFVLEQIKTHIYQWEGTAADNNL